VQDIPKVNHTQLLDLLTSVSTRRTVMVWGPPGIGKSSAVEAFGRAVGMPVQVAMASQMASEDLIGVPISDHATRTSRFYPPSIIARNEPYILFLDEINGAHPDVQRALFSLIYDRSIGEYRLPAGSAVVCAGNGAGTNAVARPLPAPLINRMVHVELRLELRGWLAWAHEAGLHLLVMGYVEARGVSVLSGNVPGGDEVFTTPRSWHMASDVLMDMGVPGVPEEGRDDPLDLIRLAAGSTLSAAQAEGFLAWVRTRHEGLNLGRLLRGEVKLPDMEAQRSTAIELAHLLGMRLATELPREEARLRGESLALALGGKRLIAEFAVRSPEIAMLIVNREGLPEWFVSQVIEELPTMRAGV